MNERQDENMAVSLRTRGWTCFPPGKTDDGGIAPLETESDLLAIGRFGVCIVLVAAVVVAEFFLGWTVS